MHERTVSRAEFRRPVQCLWLRHAKKRERSRGPWTLLLGWNFRESGTIPWIQKWMISARRSIIWSTPDSPSSEARTMLSNSFGASRIRPAGLVPSWFGPTTGPRRTILDVHSNSSRPRYARRSVAQRAPSRRRRLGTTAAPRTHGKVGRRQSTRLIDDYERERKARQNQVIGGPGD